MSHLIERSRRINARLGGSPQEMLCSRLWRFMPLTFIPVLMIDFTFYLARGGHCRECAEWEKDREQGAG